MDPGPASVVFTTVGSMDDARALARRLVGDEVAACVQLLPIDSVYRWNGVVQEEAEVLVLIKAPTASVVAVEAVLAAHHPYDVPEVLHVAMDGGLPAYLQWLADSTSTG